MQYFNLLINILIPHFPSQCLFKAKFKMDVSAHDTEFALLHFSVSVIYEIPSWILNTLSKYKYLHSHTLPRSALAHLHTQTAD